MWGNELLGGYLRSPSAVLVNNVKVNYNNLVIDCEGRRNLKVIQ